MNSSDQAFFDLAMKVIGGQATPDEWAALNAQFAADPALKAEFDQLKVDVAVARETLPLLDAMEATTPPLPGYARERLRTKVRQTLGPPVRQRASTGVWRWWLAWATACAAVALVVVSTAVFNSPPHALSPPLTPLIQVAMLDSIGGTRGTGEKPLDTLQRQWKEAQPQVFSDADKLKRWQEEWPSGAKQSVAKVLYNRDTQELKVLIRSKGKTVLEKIILVTEERELPRALKEAEAFITGPRS